MSTPNVFSTINYLEDTFYKMLTYQNQNSKSIIGYCSN